MKMKGINHWIKEVLAIGEQETVREAAKLIHNNNISALLILDDGHAKGIITERDITKAVATASDFDAVSVSQVMTPDPITIKVTESLTNARNLMLNHDFRHMPVVNDENKVMGIVSLRDLVKIWEIKVNSDPRNQVEI